MKSTHYIVPLISAFFLTFASCTKEFRTLDGVVWGTTYHIVYESDCDLSDSIAAVTGRIDRSLSVFNGESLVRAVNENRTASVDSDFIRVFDCAVRVNEVSGGLFDPTIAPLAALWGFGPEGDTAVPDSAVVAEALQSVGIANCHISGYTIFKKNANTAFDFSALAKGYGVDEIALMLERNGVNNYMTEVGGEIRVLGLNPRGSKWHIQIDAPDSDVLHARLGIVELGPAPTAIASSGNYRNFRTDSIGRRYGHTLSPLTGYPVQTSVLAASVIGPDCITADAMATACMCIEPEIALTMLANAGLRGLLVVVAGDSTAIVTTPVFP